MFTVELRPGDTTIVSWKKLLKDANKVNSGSGSASVAAAPVAAPTAMQSALEPRAVQVIVFVLFYIRSTFSTSNLYFASSDVVLVRECSSREGSCYCEGHPKYRAWSSHVILVTMGSVYLLLRMADIAFYGLKSLLFDGIQSNGLLKLTFACNWILWLHQDSCYCYLRLSIISND